MLGRAGLIALLSLLSACGQKDARILIDPPALPDAPIRDGDTRVEIRDVVLPAYAASSDILVEGSDGALHPVSGAVWAGDPVHDVSAALAERLDLRTSARVAAEPWPLSEGPDRRVEVRFERLVAGNDGVLRATGQVAISAPGGGRERLERFAVTVPIAASGPAALGSALGAALDALAAKIAPWL